MPASSASKSRNAKEYFIAGGTAGVISRTCIAPIERVKILFQVTKAQAVGGGSPWHLPRQIWHEEGAAAFWKGNTAAVVRVMPYMSITFLSYEEYKQQLAQHGRPKQACNLAAGSCAGVTAVAATYPLDLVRTSMARPGSTYTGMFDALLRISAERGVGALYSGISATFLGVAPYSGLKFASYEAIKGFLGNWLSLDEAELKPWQRVGAGAVAGLLAQTAVYPFDVVRRRMQMHEGKQRLYASPMHALATIAREEGIVRGLYRGLSLNYLKTMPNVAIYMSLYDIIKMHLISSR